MQMIMFFVGPESAVTLERQRKVVRSVVRSEAVMLIDRPAPAMQIVKRMPSVPTMPYEPEERREATEEELERWDGLY